ncbi:hypothetical protein C8A03DRAFT_37412 [Achaetomium macrosporum]|uniref:F-box domain-containing protein n=1 Tax=Achaetomium macrosporum TaxID=79813 RepID=A0AAN7HB58_9PEZI|nr:hypothetical protein C8A03DRAFT_37412 [Achaetomium macrosporum]
MGKVRRLFSKFHIRLSSKSTSMPTAPSHDPAPSGSAVQTTRQSSTVAQLNAPFENLPAEIRREILGALEYEGLRALVHASPAFHQQFRLDRRSLLCGCLRKRLRAAAVDACAAYRPGLDSFSDTRTKESVAEFLKAYQDRRSSATYSIEDEALTEDEAAAMIAFHFTVIEPLSKRFTNWALGHLADETGGSPHHKPLSATEETRVMRAMYRFQLCCNLFHERYDRPLRHNLDPIDVVKLFFCLFEPWEVEEVVCIHNFSKHEFDRIFRDIHWDLNQENPKFADQDRPPTPDGAFNFDDAWERSNYLGGTVMCGLELLHTVLFKMRDHEHLVTTMQKSISLDGQLFDGALLQATQWKRHEEQLSERDLKQQARDPLPFMGDLEPDTHGSCPPLAWTLIWKGTYSNLYGEYLDDDMRRWGYVMWDAARLKTEGGKDLLLRQWGSEWDPREMGF